MSFPEKTIWQYGDRLTTPGELNVLYTFYEPAVKSGRIKAVAPVGQPIDKSIVLYLASKSKYSNIKVLSFLNSIRYYSAERKDEKYRLPQLQDIRSGEIKETFKSIFTPLKIATKEVGDSAGNLTSAVYKPLIPIAVIAGSGALLYFGVKSGFFKKILARGKK